MSQLRQHPPSCERPQFYVIENAAVQGIQIIAFTTGVKWASIDDDVLREGFKKASSNMGAMGTTQECLARTNWLGSLATVLRVNFIRTNREWDAYIGRVN